MKINYQSILFLQLTVPLQVMETMNFAIVKLVLKMKEIAILMMSVSQVLLVEQTIANPHLVLTKKLIVVFIQVLEMKIFVPLEILVGKMKETVILMMNVSQVLFVDQIIVQHHLVLTKKLIVVIYQMKINAMIPVIKKTGKVITIVMIPTTIVDVNGMEETVVVVMLTQLIVQFVNVWTQMNQDQERNKSY